MDFHTTFAGRCLAGTSRRRLSKECSNQSYTYNILFGNMLYIIWKVYNIRYHHVWDVQLPSLLRLPPHSYRQPRYNIVPTLYAVGITFSNMYCNQQFSCTCAQVGRHESEMQRLHHNNRHAVSWTRTKWEKLWTKTKGIFILLSTNPHLLIYMPRN